MKLLLSALLIGAFLFPQLSHSQEVTDYSCPDGGTYQNNAELGHICSEPAPSGTLYHLIRLDEVIAVGSSPAQVCSTGAPIILETIAANAPEYRSDFNLTSSGPNAAGTRCDIAYNYQSRSYCGDGTTNYCYQTLNGSSSGFIQIQPEQKYCPPDSAPALKSFGGDAPDEFCWAPAVNQNDCPEENGDCEPEPDCPPDTIGGCEPDPDCVPGGSGMLVCRADPDEKCTIDAYGDTQCEEGCGYVNDEFMCLTEPNDLPDFNKCKFTTNGYACPSEPDDEITDPDTPVPDLKKSDLKDVNIGIESRQDKTNDLLETQMGEDKANTKAITDSVNNMNNNLGGKLDGIGEGIDGIVEGIDGIAGSLAPAENQDITGNGNYESWWESEYDDGISGVWAEHSAAIMQTPFFEFIQQFHLSPSGTQPDWNMCFNLGALGNFGCQDLQIPSIIWAFIRIVMIISATFLARRIIFGG